MGSGASSATVDQQPTERLVMAFESVSAACVPACPPDMSPPSINCPSFLRISASSAAALCDESLVTEGVVEVAEPVADEAAAEQWLGKAWPQLKQVGARLVALARRRRARALESAGVGDGLLGGGGNRSVAVEEVF